MSPQLVEAREFPQIFGTEKLTNKKYARKKVSFVGDSGRIRSELGDSFASTRGNERAGLGWIRFRRDASRRYAGCLWDSDCSERFNAYCNGKSATERNKHYGTDGLYR
jgi:hypothetical protein